MLITNKSRVKGLQCCSNLFSYRPGLHGRNVSLTSAINRGKSRETYKERPRWTDRAPKLDSEGARGDDPSSPFAYRAGKYVSRHVPEPQDQTRSKRLWPRSDQSNASRSVDTSQRYTERPGINRERPDRRQDPTDPGLPMSIPYTTSSSQFLYGHNVVHAALLAKRRKLYRLHLVRSARSNALGEGRGLDTIISLANTMGIPVETNTNIRLLDQMSEGRPHNGVVLEASALPAPPVLSLGKVTGNVPLSLDRQSAEDVAVNGSPTMLPFSSSRRRHPFVIMLDGITDPGNVGNIIRSAYFYGVDAVAISTNTCANLSSATLAKASSGACEAVPILAITKPGNFIYDSAKNGWQICAAVAPVPGQRSRHRRATTSSVSAYSPLLRRPCILMLGAEGEGLRDYLRARSDLDVSIEAGDRDRSGIDVGVDSMNVAVAAGVLMDAFLRRPTHGNVRDG